MQQFFLSFFVFILLEFLFLQHLFKLKEYAIFQLA